MIKYDAYLFAHFCCAILHLYFWAKSSKGYLTTVWWIRTDMYACVLMYVWMDVEIGEPHFSAVWNNKFYNKHKDICPVMFRLLTVVHSLGHTSQNTNKDVNQQHISNNNNNNHKSFAWKSSKQIEICTILLRVQMRQGESNLVGLPTIKLCNTCLFKFELRKNRKNFIRLIEAMTIK